MIGAVQLGLLAACVVVLVPMGHWPVIISAATRCSSSAAPSSSLSQSAFTSPLTSLRHRLRHHRLLRRRLREPPRILPFPPPRRRLGTSTPPPISTPSTTTRSITTSPGLGTLRLPPPSPLVAFRSGSFRRLRFAQRILGRRRRGLSGEARRGFAVESGFGFGAVSSEIGITPDVLVMGNGLWHMLHFTNASDYGVSLQSLRTHAVSLAPLEPVVPARPSPHLFWVGMPTLINSMLNTEEKREKMTDALRAAYDEQLRKSNLLRKSSNGPFLLLDIESLSWNCGVRCTVDGMHYDLYVYEAALHIMLNALLIESHQKL
ncbi:hypothetical protein M0R45_006207 [Rubus argutus]|uniref:Uncharacterized protein n=1 Tax=Rubus argutus TaxID=59490 RepID=A0AAW1YPX0_RUBAR